MKSDGIKKIIIFNIIILFFFLVILELGLSVTFYLKDEKSPLTLSNSVIDFPYTYYTFVPEEKNGTIISNEDGLYTHYGRKKQDNAVRILLLGGSTVRSMFASSYDNTISANVERLLQNEFLNKKIEVINAGMSGYVVEQLFIFYQLVLSKYNPDIVVGLNGYNDLMSVKLNRYSGIYFAPQNMQQFKVIEQGKAKKAFMGRLSNIFPNTFRMSSSMRRYFSGKNQYDYSSFGETQIKKAESDYLNIINDIHSFCLVNDVSHIEFLQPIKWYVKSDREASANRGAVPGLLNLYAAYDNGIRQLDYGYSLTDLFNNKDEVFRDDCHFFDYGNEIIASAMVPLIKQVLMKKFKGDKQN